MAKHLKYASQQNLFFYSLQKVISHRNSHVSKNQILIIDHYEIVGEHMRPCAEIRRR